MLAGLKLRAHILQRLIHVFEDLFGILAIIAISRKIRRNKLGFGGTTGIDDIRFPMFDSYAVSHSLASSTVRAHVPGQTQHTVWCTVSEAECQIKKGTLQNWTGQGAEHSSQAIRIKAQFPKLLGQQRGPLVLCFGALAFCFGPLVLCFGPLAFMVATLCSCGNDYAPLVAPP
jgi:hypothetical protein